MGGWLYNDYNTNLSSTGTGLELELSLAMSQIVEQALAVLGKAQLKLGLSFTSINSHLIDEQDKLLPRLTIKQYQ